MKILVTGANGQLGNEIREIELRFSNLGFLFTDVDTLDITNENSVHTFFAEHNPGFVINCAAYTAVDRAEEEPQIAEKLNSLAPKILAKISKKYNTKLIHISTDYVFNGKSFIPYSENDLTDPQSVYGKTKLQGELNVLNENQEAIIIRTSWLYSAFGNNFVKTMLKMATLRDELNVVFDQVGTPTNGADLAEAILKIIQLSAKKPGRFIPGIYHYSNEGVASWYDFAQAVFDIASIRCSLKPVLSDEFPTPANRPAYSVLNKSKIRDTFNLEIPYWRNSLKIYLKQIQNNIHG